MTIAKASHFQSDLRELFKKYGIPSGCAMFMHDGTFHPIECHVTERNEFVVSMMNAIEQGVKGLNIPTYTHTTPNDDN